MDMMLQESKLIKRTMGCINLQIIYNMFKKSTKDLVNQGRRSPHILINQSHNAKFINPSVPLISLDYCNIVSIKDKSCLKLSIPHGSYRLRS